VPKAPIVIRQRWWGHLAVMLCLPVVALLGAAMAWAGIGLFAEAGGWWKGVILLAFATFMMFVVVGLLNHLFTFRVEIYPHGLRLAGNFWSHRMTWQEITRIEKRHNYRAPGYHVEIEVDGSRLPRRHWSNLWWARYQIPFGMEKDAGRLAEYLRRKRREALKRQQAADAQ
jgi:hypothetical protein